MLRALSLDSLSSAPPPSPNISYVGNQKAPLASQASGKLLQGPGRGPEALDGEEDRCMVSEDKLPVRGDEGLLRVKNDGLSWN